MKQCIRQLGIVAGIFLFFMLAGQMKLVASNKVGELTVTFLDVGQGDCILLQSEGQTMLVDAGKAEYGQTVVDYLKSQGVTNLTYAVITHDDADHIGGYASVLKNIVINKIIHTSCRYNEETNSKIVNDLIMKSSIKTEVPVAGASMQFGSATIQFLAPNSKQYSAYNDYSIVMRVVNGKNSFLLTGDAEAISEREMLQKGYTLKSDVLKVGHHSALTSSSQEFIDAVEPSISIISCNSQGKAGFPRLATLAKLTKSDIFRTDISGNIVMVSDGTYITTEQEPYFYANSDFDSATGNIERTTEAECSTLKDIYMEADCEGFQLLNLSDDEDYEKTYRKSIELHFFADCGPARLDNIAYALIDAGEEPDIDEIEWTEMNDGVVSIEKDFSGSVYIKFENSLGNIVIRKTSGFLIDCNAPTSCKVKSNFSNLKLVSPNAINSYNRYPVDDWNPQFTFSCKYGISGKGSIEYKLVERGEEYDGSTGWTIGNQVEITDDFIGRIYVRFEDGAGNYVVKKTQGFTWIAGNPTNLKVETNINGVKLLMPSQGAKQCYVNKGKITLKFSADFGHGGKQAIQYQIVKVGKKYNAKGKWVTASALSLNKGFAGKIYLRFIDKAGNCVVRKTNVMRIKK